MEERKEMLMQIISELNETAKKITEYNKLAKKADISDTVLAVDWSPSSGSHFLKNGFNIQMRNIDKETVLGDEKKYDNGDYHAKYVDVGTTRLFVVEINQ